MLMFLESVIAPDQLNAVGDDRGASKDFASLRHWQLTAAPDGVVHWHVDGHRSHLPARNLRYSHYNYNSRRRATFWQATRLRTAAQEEDAAA